MHDFHTRPFTWHMSLVLETGKGPYTITGEALTSQENLESVPDSRSPFQMIELYMDFETKWRSKENILQVVEKDRSGVLCNRDPGLLARSIYA